MPSSPVVSEFLQAMPLPSSSSSFPSEPLPRPPDSDIHLTRTYHIRRRIRNPIFPAGGPGSRSKKGGAVALARRSGPSTPLLHWKLNEKPAEREVDEAGEEAAVEARRSVSARKLAAGIWHLRPLNAGSFCGGDGGADRERSRVGLEPKPGHLQVQLLHNPLATDLHTYYDKKTDTASPVSVLSPKSGDLSKVKKLIGFPSSLMEKSTKWDPGSSMSLEEVCRFYSHLKLLDDQGLKTVSIVSSLRSDLEMARFRIVELETEQRAAKKKLDRFLRRLTEEKELWRRREHQKVRSVIDCMKDDLNKERKMRQRWEIVNSKLVDELAETKLSIKHFLQGYEKERKERELAEEVCNELANEIDEDKVAIESLKMEALRIRETVEEEKKMLQIAEVWREERVQMKLTDAKLTLEDKYCQLVQLISELDGFLGSTKTGNLDAALIREAELLKRKVEPLKVAEIEEFVYQPPIDSEDIYAVFEELQSIDETGENDIDPCDYDPASHLSNVSNPNMTSPEAEAFLKQQTKQRTNQLIDNDDYAEDGSSWETVTNHEEQGSNYSPDGSEPSVSGYYKSSSTSISASERENNGKFKQDTEMIDASSYKKTLIKKVPSFYRLWRSSAPDNVKDSRRASSELKNARLSNARSSCVTVSSVNGEDQKKVSVEMENGRIINISMPPEMELSEVGFSPGSIGQWSSPDSAYAHGLKGCIEWPRNSQKNSLKAKLMEARVEGQKIQLRHVLKQKI